MPETPPILVVNPGSTSTKVAIAFEGSIQQQETFRHTAEEVKNKPRIWDQYPDRLECCLRWTQDRMHACSAVIALGGLLRPLPGGIYAVNTKMLEDSRANLQGEHASNLGCVLAYELANVYGARALVVDPVSVDEFESIAYYSGHPEIKRRSLSHALNIHSAARRAANEFGIPLNNSAFIIGHLGGGISIAPVRNGKIIDVNDASSDGPFSPERTGGLPIQPFISIFYSHRYTEQELRQFVMGRGGLTAYLGTNSIPEVEKRIAEGDTHAQEVLQAMAYQIAKEIGAMATVLNGSVDGIVLTGGAASSAMLTSWITQRVKFIAPVVLYPGEHEMQALAAAAFRALSGEEPVKEY